MKKRTKKIAALLATCMLATALVGCGNANVSTQSGSKEESKTSSVEQESSSTVVNEEPIVLTVLTRSNVSQDGPLVYEEANKYIEEKLGFTVEFVDLGQNEFAEKSKMMFATGDYFDVTFTADSVDFYTNAANGVYLSLDDLLDEYGKDILAAAPDYLFGAATVNGEIYAVPHLKDMVWPYYFQVKSYYVDKYNLDLNGIDTLEEMEPVLQIIKDNEPGVVPLLMKSNYNCFVTMDWDIVSGTKVLAWDDNGKIVNIYEQEEMKDFFALMRSWNEKGFFPQDVETLTSLGDNTGTGAWATQFASYGPMLYSDPKDPNRTTRKTEDGLLNSSGDWPADGSTLSKGILANSGIMGGAWAISAESDYPEKAMQFINLIDTDAYLRNLMSYGIEGKHYEKVGENQYKFLPEGTTKAADTGYAPYSYMLGSTYNLLVKDSQPADYWKQYEKMNNNAIPSKGLGFVVNLDDISTEIAAIANAYNEYAPALECGAVADWEKSLEAFNQKLYSVGLQTVIDEVQKQYDAWKVANNK